MSAYAQSLSDIDFGGIVDGIVGGAEDIASDLVGKAEEGVKSASTTLVNSGSQALSREINTLVNGGTPTATLPAPQSAETPVTTRTATKGGNFLSGLPTWALPAGVGVGVYFWQKSILWAVGATAVAFFVSSKMRKGGV